MGIVLDQSNVIHEDVNEQWGQPPKVEVDKHVIAEVDQRLPVKLNSQQK